MATAFPAGHALPAETPAPAAPPGLGLRPRGEEPPKLPSPIQALNSAYSLLGEQGTSARKTQPHTPKTPREPSGNKIPVEDPGEGR